MAWTALLHHKNVDIIVGIDISLVAPVPLDTHVERNERIGKRRVCPCPHLLLCDFSPIILRNSYLQFKSKQPCPPHNLNTLPKSHCWQSGRVFANVEDFFASRRSNVWAILTERKYTKCDLCALPLRMSAISRKLIRNEKFLIKKLQLKR